MDIRPSGTVTFVFTDIEGSTKLWDERPETMRVALAQHDTIVRNAIERANGFVFSTGGDGFAAAFHRAEDALRAAVDAQRQLGTTAWPDDAELRVRMGVHTGETQERDGDYFGASVNRAARVMSLASGAQILCSLTTSELLRDAHALPAECSLETLGTFRLKGLRGTEQVFGVSGPGLATVGVSVRAADQEGNVPRTFTRLIGRGAGR